MGVEQQLLAVGEVLREGVANGGEGLVALSVDHHMTLVASGLWNSFHAAILPSRNFTTPIYVFS